MEPGNKQYMGYYGNEFIRNVLWFLHIVYVLC